MKLKTLLLSAVLLSALGEVRAYTGSAPIAGNTYYLYNPGHNQFLFVGLDEQYGVTPSVFNATPIYVETGTSGSSNWTFSYVIRGTKYYIYQSNGGGSLNTSSGSEFEPKLSDDKYRLQTQKHTKTLTTYYYMLHAGTSGGQCSFEEYKSSSNNGYEWQFIAVSDVESARSAMAESCAATAASYATESNGWERVTSVSALHTSPENYYFAIFSANTTGLMLQATSNNAETQKLYYKTAVNPVNGAQYLFEMENHESGGFALKSRAIGKYFSNATSYNFHADQTSATSSNYTNLTLTYANGAFTIETAQATNYVGLWDLITTWYSTDKKLAGNKQSSLAGSFLIYRIPKQRLRNVDFTQCITNPSFETGNTDGWTVGASSDTGARSVTQDEGKYAMSNSAGSYLFNTWWQGIPMTQNIGVLPAGQYTLSAVTTTDQNAKTYLTVNSGHNDGATSTGGASVGVTNTYNFTLAEATEVTIGVVGCGNNDEKAFDANGYYWYKVDNFRLTYLGGMEDLTAVSGKMKASVETAQTTAVNTYNSSKTVANYIAAIDAIAAAEASIAAYAKAKSYLDAMETLLETTNIYTTAAYATNYSTPLAAYNDGTLTDEAADALSFGSRVTGNMPALLLSPWTAGDGETQTASLTEGTPYINTWSVEGDSDGSNFKTPFFEYYVNDGENLGAKTFVATLNGLPASSSYKVEVWARVRQRNGGTKKSGSITMKVGSGDAEDLTVGTQVGPTSPLYLDHFTAKGSTDGSGNLTVTITVTANSDINWLSFRDMKYTRLADASDYSALNAAISTAEAKTLGFETGEYAPYNNIAALTALAAAKAINQEADNTQEAVQTATSNLTGTTWTANVGEVNAFYRGDFSEYAEDTTTPLDYTPSGWTASDNFRMMLTNSTNYPGLADASATHALMSWSGGVTYGETTGYTIPLKANTVYRLQFKAAGWNNETRSGMTVSVLNSSDGLAATNLGTPDRDIVGNANNTAGMTSYNKLFATGAAGNYVFHIQSGNNLVVTDFELKRASETLSETATSALSTTGLYKSITLTRTLKGGQWNGFSVPFSFDVDGSALEGASVKQWKSVSDNEITLEDATEIVAGEPYLVKPTANDNANIVNPTFNGVIVENPSEAVKGTGDYTFQAHLYNTGLATDGSVAYVSTTDSSIKKLTSGGIKGLRAIFNIPTGGSVKTLTVNIGDDTTGILTVDAEGNITEAGAIYNLAGQRMNKAQKGVNIINGRKILIK